MASDVVARLLTAADGISVAMVELDEDDAGYWCAACGYTRADREALLAPDAHADQCPWRALIEAAAALRSVEARDVWVVSSPVFKFSDLASLRQGEVDRLCRAPSAAKVTHYRAYPVTTPAPAPASEGSGAA